MYLIHVEREVALPIDTVWQVLSDVHKYPQNIAFVKKVFGPKDIQPGVSWSDMTTVLWIPLIIEHRVEKMDKQHIFYSLHGIGIRHEEEHIRLKELSKKSTKITIDISFTLFSPLDRLLGKFVQQRLYVMCMKTIEILEAKYL